MWEIHKGNLVALEHKQPGLLSPINAGINLQGNMGIQDGASLIPIWQGSETYFERADIWAKIGWDLQVLVVRKYISEGESAVWVK